MGTINGKNWQVLVGDCRDRLKDLPDNSVDSIVTDPPYELGFMGKKWDSSGIAYDQSVWEECLRVLKPGGHLLSFGGTRTFHRMAVAIEDAGFEIRDSIAWLYSSGFPKSMNIGKAIDKAAGADVKVGKAFKMAGEYGGRNLDNARDRYAEAERHVEQTDEAKQWAGWGTALKPAFEPVVVARKPISERNIVNNVLIHGVGGINIDGTRIGERWPANAILDENEATKLDGQANASQFFYVSKTSKRDRNEGLENVTPRFAPTMGDGIGGKEHNPETATPKQNFHPTVKPTDLMRYLIKLVTPEGGTVLDPFTGSGSTGKAALLNGNKFIGVELTSDYLPIIEGRLTHAENKYSETIESELK